jgi:hypothetical protein
MAAALAALNNYLDNTIGIHDQATRLSLNGQGLESFDDFLTFTEKEIGEMCTNVRKPGGTIANPAFDPNNIVPGIPATIPNPGLTLGLGYEKRLKMLRYYIHHLNRIQRTMVPAQATLARLTACYRRKEEEDEDEDVELPSKMTRIDKVREVLENIDNYLTQKRGGSGLSLAYVVRDDVNLPAVDPGYGMPTMVDEMISRGPHFGQYYQQDNIDVWQVIRHVTHGGPGWSWVQEFHRTSNGRQAYLAIKTHYLGESYSSRIRSQADNTIENSFYDGKSRSFTFERYCEVLKTAFTDIENTGEAVSETRKVRVLLQGITDPRLITAKSTVIATPALKDTFDNAINFIAQFQVERSSHEGTRGAQQRNVSALTSHNRGGSGRGGGRGGRGAGRSGQRGGGRSTSGRSGAGRTVQSGRSSVDSTGRPYYSYQDWRAMTTDQQQRIRDQRINQSRLNSQRTVNVTERNVRSRIETDNQSAAPIDTVTVTQPSVISAVTTQRRPINNREL